LDGKHSEVVRIFLGELDKDWSGEIALHVAP
jgi:hypothetical protein